MLYRLLGSLITMTFTSTLLVWAGVIPNPFGSTFGFLANGQMVEHPVSEVRSALSGLEMPDDLPCEGILCGRTEKSIEMTGKGETELAWTMYADQHPIATYTAKLEPKKEGAATVIFTSLAKHDLPAGAKNNRGLDAGAESEDLFKLATAEALSKLSPQLAIAAEEQRRQTLQAHGMKTAVQVMANPLAVQREAMAMQRDFAEIERDVRKSTEERKVQDWYAGRTSSYGSRAGQPSIEAGKPMVNPNTPTYN